jgi:acyl-coenzyme A thioesterase 9
VHVENARRRKEAAQLALTKMPPTAEERLLIHDLHLQSRSLTRQSGVGLHDDYEWTHNTVMTTTSLCQPQDRNIHNKVSGRRS